MQTTTLGELLSNEEIKIVTQLLKTDKDAELKAYLNEPLRKIKLEEKGILADYLYYNLIYQKGKAK